MQHRTVRQTLIIFCLLISGCVPSPVISPGVLSRNRPGNPKAELIFSSTPAATPTRIKATLTPTPNLIKTSALLQRTLAHIDITPTPFEMTNLEPLSATNVFRIKKLAQYYPHTKETPPQPSEVVFSPDSNYLAYIDATDDSVVLWNLSIQQVSQRLYIQPSPDDGKSPITPFIGAVAGPRFTQDGKYLAIINNTGPQMWDIASGNLVLHSRGPDEMTRESQRYMQQFTDLLISPDGGKFFTSSYFAGSSMTTWDAITGEIIGQRFALDNGISKLVLSPDQRFFLSVNRGGHISFYDPSNGEPADFSIESICFEDGECNQLDKQVCREAIYGAAISPDSKILAVECGGLDYSVNPICNLTNDTSMMDMKRGCGEIVIFNTKSWNRVASLPSYLHKSGGISFNGDGGILAVGVDQTKYQVEFWSIQEERAVHSVGGFAHNFLKIEFSPDGRLLLIQTGNGEVQLWGVEK